MTGINVGLLPSPSWERSESPPRHRHFTVCLYLSYDAAVLAGRDLWHCHDELESRARHGSLTRTHDVRAEAAGIRGIGPFAGPAAARTRAGEREPRSRTCPGPANHSDSERAQDREGAMPRRDRRALTAAGAPPLKLDSVEASGSRTLVRVVGAGELPATVRAAPGPSPARAEASGGRRPGRSRAGRRRSESRTPGPAAVRGEPLASLRAGHGPGADPEHRRT